MTRLLVSARIAPFSETPELAVRHAEDVVEVDGVTRESFGPDCWLAGGKGAEVQYGHDADCIGSVVVLAARNGFWYADMVIDTDDPEALEQIKVGAPVSIGARSIRRDEDVHLRIRRHRMAQLEHIAIARKGERGAFARALITNVVAGDSMPKLTAAAESATITKLKSAASGVDWRTVLPRGYEEFADTDIDLQPGDELLIGGSKRGARWDGQRFIVQQNYAKVA